MSYLSEVEKQLDLPPAQKAEVMRELTAHYNELRDELIADGVKLTWADEEAAHKLGSSTDVAARLSAVHNTANWKSALLAALPLIGIVLPLLTCCRALFIITTCVFYAILLIGSIREFTMNRRPIWLATWTAAVFYGFVSIGQYAATAITNAIPDADLFYLHIVARCVVPAVLTVAVVWPRPIYRNATLCLGMVMAVFTASYVFSVAIPPVLSLPVLALAGVTWLAIHVILALRVFTDHPYGSGTKAALFLLVFLVLQLNQIENSQQIPVILSAVIPIAAVVLFARTSKRSYKLAALCAGLFLAGIIRLGITNYGSENYTFSIVAMILPFVVTAATPLLYEHWTRRRATPPQIVQ